MLKGWKYPLLLAAGLWLLYLAVVGFFSPSWRDWVPPRWDGVHYLSIAERGYEIKRCDSSLAQQGWIWCGNPWFPGWPYWNEILWRGMGLRALGLSLNAVFLSQAALLLLGLMTLLGRYSHYFLREVGGREARSQRALGAWSCAALVCQPGSFYFLTQFPYTFTLLTGFLFLIFYRMGLEAGARKFKIAAAVSGAWTGLAYPTGFFFLVYPFADFLKKAVQQKVLGLGKIFFWFGVFGFGTLAVCLIFYYKFDLFWLYFEHNAQYSRTGGNPFGVLWDLFQVGSMNERLTFLWYAVGVVLIGFLAHQPWREPSFYFLLLAILFSPLTGSWICLYRHYLLCLPLGALLGSGCQNQRPRGWQTGLRAAYLLCGLVLQIYYLMPRFLQGQLM